VALDHTLYDLSQQLLTRFAWRGVAMIEFKTDAATGRHYLMEINGRFWGSLQLAIDAGVDFPRILASLALGDGAPAQGAYRVGVRSRWFWGQVDHVIARVRRRNAHIPPGTISTGSAIADLIFGPLRTASSEEVFRWSDPRPFIRETFSWFGFK
jgi:predicted ATP-grasp superfamily ATP-dependent carboligase